MDASTRPSAIRRQKLQPTRRTLAAFLFAAVAQCFAIPAHASQSADAATPAEAAIVSSIASSTAHEIAIHVVKPGEESISLAARLTDVSANLAKDVTWQLRNELGELVKTETGTELSMPLPPGLYVVEAAYGAAHVRESVTLLEGNAIAVSFVLNAGGLRVLPAIKNLEVQGLTTETRVYALFGPEKGKLVAHSALPGEIIKLPAGQYRVESVFGSGNAKAITDVRVRPGKLSAVEVKHQGGLARLSFVGSPSAKVTWDIKDQGGSSIATFEGLEHQLALTPGTYHAEAHVNGEVLSALFRIAPGESRDILLGN